MMNNAPTKIKLDEAQLEKLAYNLVIPTLNDVIARKASEEVIRLHAGMIGTKLLRNEPLLEKERLALGYVNSLILKGEDANVAYGLKTKHRRKNDIGEEKAIAFHIWKLINIFDYKNNEAIKVIAECKMGGKCRGYDAVSNIYNKHKDEITSKAEALISTSTTTL